MRKVNMENIMDETTVAMLTDEHNTTFYNENNLSLYNGENQKNVYDTNISMHVDSEKADIQHNLERVLTMMTDLNTAFNRSVGAPENMRLFKVKNASVRYAGHNTAVINIDAAALATGNDNAINVLMDRKRMAKNIWETEGVTYKVNYTPDQPSKEKQGLGNALRSWQVVMRNHGVNAQAMAI